jgi:methylmalonyl-CoA mutase N-terminal domain/subunit
MVPNTDWGGSVSDAARSESDLPIQAVYGADALDGFDPEAVLGVPGQFPFTRGVYPTMYTGRPWTMRQYAGFGTAKESNERYHELVSAGTGGLSVAFDLPTQMGYDSDAAAARGEVGKVGVAIDSIEDMRTLLAGLPLDQISTSMTINAPAATLLLMYQLVAEEQGIANAKEYVRTALAAGLDVDDFAPRLSFFFVARTTLLEEIAKFRAARRIWARIMREEFEAKNPKSQMLRFHTQTAGVQLTAQQPEVNLVRVALQALSAVLGGTQSLHTNSYDEAIALPTEKAARLALRTQQVIAYETDVTKTVDPFAGSYAIESMTGDLEAAALSLIQAVEDRGGAVAAIEQGFQKTEIEAAAYRIAREIDSGARTVVGVNKYSSDDDEPYQPLRVDPQIEADQCERLAVLRRERDNQAVARALGDLRITAAGTGNVLPAMRDALALRATGGEVANALRDVWGVYQPHDTF